MRATECIARYIHTYYSGTLKRRKNTTKRKTLCANENLFVTEIYVFEPNRISQHHFLDIHFFVFFFVGSFGRFVRWLVLAFLGNDGVAAATTISYFIEMHARTRAHWHTDNDECTICSIVCKCEFKILILKCLETFALSFGAFRIKWNGTKQNYVGISLRELIAMYVVKAYKIHTHSLCRTAPP